VLLVTSHVWNKHEIHKGHLVTCYLRRKEGSRVIGLPYLTSALDREGCSTSRLGRSPHGKDTAFLVQESGCVLGPVWKGVENLTPHGSSNHWPNHYACCAIPPYWNIYLDSIKMCLKIKMVEERGMALCGWEQGRVKGFCEHGNELWCSKQCG
jgi:hypothetical protein